MNLPKIILKQSSYSVTKSRRYVRLILPMNWGSQKPSVSVAMKNLRENGYITVDGDGFIRLTQAGLDIAEMIYERHTLISTWLIRLGVNPKTAAEDACRIEHVISAESFEAIKKHVGPQPESTAAK